MKTKIVVLLTIFIDVVGIGIIIPVLPTYVRSFGVSDVVVTVLFAVYAFLSFFSAPFLGALSDKIGRKPVLIVSIISSAIGWLVFASAGSIVALFIGRSIDGLAAGNITTAQSALADIARDEKERTLNLGLFGAMFGLGFIVGPALGGLLAGISINTPFWFVGILSIVNVVLAMIILPETHKTKRADSQISYNPFKPIRDGFRNKEMRILFFVWLLIGVALATQQSVFTLYVARVFGIGVQSAGILFSGIGVLILINQTVLLKRVWLPRFREKTLGKIMLGVFAIGMLAQSVPVFAVFLAGLVATTIGQGNLRTVFSSMIAGFNKNKTGEYLGIATSIMSLAMIIGPLLATATFTLHPTIPFIVAGILTGLGFFIFSTRPLHHVA